MARWIFSFFFSSPASLSFELGDLVMLIYSFVYGIGVVIAMKMPVILWVLLIQAHLLLAVYQLGIFHCMLNLLIL